MLQNTQQLQQTYNTDSFPIYFSDFHLLHRTTSSIIQIMGNEGSHGHNSSGLSDKGLLFCLFILINVSQLFYCQKSPCSKLTPILPNKVSELQSRLPCKTFFLFLLEIRGYYNVSSKISSKRLPIINFILFLCRNSNKNVHQAG